MIHFNASQFVMPFYPKPPPRGYRKRTPPRPHRPRSIAKRPDLVSRKQLLYARYKREGQRTHFALSTTLRATSIASLSASAGAIMYHFTKFVTVSDPLNNAPAYNNVQEIPSTNKTPPFDTETHLDPLSTGIALLSMGIAALSAAAFVRRENAMWDQFDDCAEHILSRTRKTAHTIKSYFKNHPSR